MFVTEAGELCFGFLPGFDVNEVRQSVAEIANHRDVAVADRSGALRLGGGRRPWRQRFTGDRMARPKILRIADAPNRPRRG